MVAEEYFFNLTNNTHYISVTLFIYTLPYFKKMKLALKLNIIKIPPVFLQLWHTVLYVKDYKTFQKLKTISSGMGFGVLGLGILPRLLQENCTLPSSIYTLQRMTLMILILFGEEHPRYTNLFYFGLWGMTIDLCPFDFEIPTKFSWL